VAYDGPQSLVGKKIIIPGLGSSVDVLFRKWLKEKGVDEKKVDFVEVPSAQTDDNLKAKNVDGAVVVEPFLTRIQQTGTGKVAARFMDGLASEKLGISYVALKSWIEAHRDAVAGFRAAIDEGAAWAREHQQEARDLTGRYVKLPKAVLDALPFPHMTTAITHDGVAWWVDVMKEQGRISTAPSVDALIAK
jgi:NitT/TauT family transport system substrate-binding protein